MLRGDDGEFWLEPVAVSLDDGTTTTTGDLGAGTRATSMYGGPTGPAGRPHLVFRRSAEQQRQQFEIGAGGRSKRRRKKKRKQERNCGTRGENSRPPTPSSCSFFLACSSFRTSSRSIYFSDFLSPFLYLSLSLSIFLSLVLSRNLYRNVFMCLHIHIYNIIGRAMVRNVGVPRLSFTFSPTYYPNKEATKGRPRKEKKDVRSVRSLARECPGAHKAVRGSQISQRTFLSVARSR